MNKLTHNMLFKTIAFIMAVLILLSTVFMVVFNIFVYDISGGYISLNRVKNAWAEKYLQKEAIALSSVLWDNENYDYRTKLGEYALDKNYFYTIYSVTEDNYLELDYDNSFDKSFDYSYNDRFYIEVYSEATQQYKTKEYEINLYLRKDLLQKDIYYVIREIIEACIDKVNSFLIFSFINTVVFVGICAYLCCSAGRRRSCDTVKLNFIDKIPFDLYAAIFILIGCVEIIFADSVSYTSNELAFLQLCTAFVVLDSVLALSVILSVATRVKTKTLLKNTITYKILKIFYKYLKIVFCKYSSIIHDLPLIPKSCAVIAAVVLMTVFIFAAFEQGGAIVLFLVECIVLIPLILYFIICLRKLQIAGQKIAEGDFEHRVETSNLYGEMRDFGECLNNIGNGMNKAVAEKIKSERLKTELITNVSHDIKTPLTSIINYVDLIKKEKPENEAVRDYLDVLDRQSGRLKKLIEDLIEASKASTGNIEAHTEKCEIGILLAQTVGEFEEKAANCGLEIIVTDEEQPVSIMADRRHLWRIFDNLMNNICKYSLDGTRVYLSVEKTSDKAVITFKNISKNALNISEDELMERFVRGDSSRNTEGSGLGLSIAKSLVELQNGEMRLAVDGDLFKVILVFDAI